MRLDLILTISEIYISSNLNPLQKYTSSSRSNKFKDIFPKNISQIITKTIPISTKIVMSYVMERIFPFWVWWKVNGDWDRNMLRNLQWRESHCRTNTSNIKGKYIQKNRAMKSKVHHFIKVTWVYNRVQQVYQKQQIGLTREPHLC